MDHHGYRSRTLAAIVVGLSCAGLLPGCALLSRANETSGGVQANADSWVPALSADGRWIAFISTASNLVAADTNEDYDVFVRDNWTKEVARVSVSTTGDQITDVGFLDAQIAISDDGRVVAFTFDLTGLVPDNTNGRALDVYWHDRDADQDGIYDEAAAITTAVASATPAGIGGTGDSLAPALNGDGSVVAFQSSAPDLLAAPDADTNDAADIFATTFDLTTGQRTSTRIVSCPPAQPMVEADGFSTRPSIDASGGVIAFDTIAREPDPSATPTSPTTSP